MDFLSREISHVTKLQHSLRIYLRKDRKNAAEGESLNKCSGVFVTFRGLHLINSAHAVGFHRGDGLTEQDEVEAGEGLYGWMVGYVAVYLLAGLSA